MEKMQQKQRKLFTQQQNFKAQQTSENCIQINLIINLF